MLSVTRRYGAVWLVILSLLLVACERPFQSDNNVPEGPTATVIVTQPDTGQGDTTGDIATATATPIPSTEGGETTGGETTEGETAGGETTGGETSGGETTGGETTGGETTEGETTEGETAGGETTGSETGGETTGETTGGEETSGESSGETTGGETSTDTAQTTTTNPTVHVVVAGDTLYKIGLRYGVSWVRLAEFNNLANPNRLTVGQQIRIPGTGDTPTPTPSPQTEEIYVVKAGDNLYRIGLAYGINWVQIAEANGIVNPNSLVVGQRIKIPVSAPGPTPQFSHQVRQGDTLFKISLQYGVSWQAIAEANDLTSPYVIFPGQVLVIPGG